VLPLVVCGRRTFLQLRQEHCQQCRGLKLTFRLDGLGTIPHPEAPSRGLAFFKGRVGSMTEQSRWHASGSLVLAFVMLVGTSTPARAAKSPMGQQSLAHRTVRGSAGLGATADPATPSSARCTTSTVSLGSIGSYTLVLKADSSVWSWGQNSFGMLGNGTTTDSSLPVQTVGIGGNGYLSGVVRLLQAASTRWLSAPMAQS
jgi:hypothetical protein